ncbi:MAG TPA: hypothetical protein VLN59_14300 [Burkholderiales bacterium]|nr:hypothetical protein [Burkholderiales bacterium]
MDQRPLRALVIAAIVAVAYNVFGIVAEHTHAFLLQEVLAHLSHARGFTLGVACGCLATSEPMILAAYVCAVFLLGPVDVVHLSFAIVAGGSIGALLQSYIRSHRHDGKPVPRPDAH